MLDLTFDVDHSPQPAEFLTCLVPQFEHTTSSVGPDVRVWQALSRQCIAVVPARYIERWHVR